MFKRQIAISLLACISVVSCKNDVVGSREVLVNPSTFRNMAAKEWNPQAQEAQLIADFLRRYKGERATRLAEKLRRADVKISLTDGDVEGQRLLDAIYAARSETLKAKADSAKSEDKGFTIATVAIVEKLPMEGVDAVVIRRPDGDPADQILLSASATSGKALALALRTLSGSKLEHGKNVKQTIQLGVKIPSDATGADALANQIQEDLEKGLQTPAKPIPGIGTARSFEIALRDLEKKS